MDAVELEAMITRVTRDYDFYDDASKMALLTGSGITARLVWLHWMPHVVLQNWPAFTMRERAVMIVVARYAARVGAAHATRAED